MGFKMFDKVMVSPDSTSMYKGRTGQVLEVYPVSNGENAYLVSIQVDHIEGWVKSFFRAEELALEWRTVVFTTQELTVIEQAMRDYHESFVERFGGEEESKMDIAAMVSACVKLGVTLDD